MKGTKTIINIVLGIAVLGMAVWLYTVIKDPIDFQSAYKKRFSATKQKLIEIRNAQKTYLQIHGKYANDFDALINMIKHDSLMTVKTIGDPNDTSIVVTYDTILEPIAAMSDFQYNADSLRYVPYSKGEEFQIASSSIEKQRVTIPVFEVIALRQHYLKGQKRKYFKNYKDLKVGSLTEGTDSGNWE